MPHTIVYQSDYTRSSNHAIIDLAEMEEKSIRRNKQLHINGVLFFKNNHFIQLIEGEKDHLEVLMLRIASDWLQKNIMRLADEPVDRLYFKSWKVDRFELSDYREITPEYISLYNSLFSEELLSPMEYIEVIRKISPM